MSLLNVKKLRQTGYQNLAPVSVLGSSILSRQYFQSEIDNRAVTWGDEQEEATRLKDSANLDTGSSNIFNVFHGADGDDAVEKIVRKRHRFGATAKQRCLHIVIPEDGSNTFVEWVRIDTVKVVAVANQFGHEDTTSIADFEETPKVRARKVLNNQAKPDILNLAEERAEVPVGMIDFTCFHQRLSREKSNHSAVPFVFREKWLA